MDQTKDNSIAPQRDYSDEELIKDFSGFTNHYATVNGTRLHYLEGGSAYSDTESIRASNAWYQTFTRDIEDAKGYQPLSMPVLGICSYISYHYMKMGLPYVAKDVQVIEIPDSGHYLYGEQPGKVLDAVVRFLASR